MSYLKQHSQNLTFFFVNFRQSVTKYYWNSKKRADKSFACCFSTFLRRGKGQKQEIPPKTVFPIFLVSNCSHFNINFDSNVLSFISFKEVPSIDKKAKAFVNKKFWFTPYELPDVLNAELFLKIWKSFKCIGVKNFADL